MNYNVSKDIQIVCKILNISYSELSNALGVARSTVTRIIKKQTLPSDLFLESFYSFAYSNSKHPIRLNQLKIEWAKDKYDKVLFHGARSAISGQIDLNHSRQDIDVGKGFYLGESFDQAASYIFLNKKSSVYILDTTKLKGLKTIELTVSLDWMIMVSYYRGQLDEYKNSNYLTKLINRLNKYDVIIAPIADNNMYEIMGQFARGEITDLQATSALSASSLGKQHVLKSEKACKSVTIVDRLYLSSFERQDIENVRKEFALLASDKAKIAIQSFRRKGKYVEELLK